MKYLKLFILIQFITLTTFAQKDSVTVKPLNSLYKGSVSMQFNVYYDFSLSAFEGLALSGKYHFSDKFAVRLGAGISFEDEDIDRFIYFEYPDTIKTNDVKYTYTVTSNALYYINPKKPVNLYFGLGPRYEFYYRKDEQPCDYFTLEFDEVLSHSYGINAVAGFEWFPVYYFGLFGEYSLVAEYRKSNYVNGKKEQGTYYGYKIHDRKIIQIRANTAKLGLSVYF